MAFAPLTLDEVSLCRPMRGEAQMLFATLDELDRTRAAPRQRWYESMGLTLLFDRARSEALVAPAYTRLCASDVRASLRGDRQLAPTQMTAPVGSAFACLANQLGCAMVSSPPSTVAGGSQWRLQDTAAAMRLTSALLWLRAHPGTQPLPQRLAALPPDLRGERRPLQATADGQGVQVALYADGEGGALHFRCLAAGCGPDALRAGVGSGRSGVRAVISSQAWHAGHAGYCRCAGSGSTATNEAVDRVGAEAPPARAAQSLRRRRAFARIPALSPSASSG